MAAGGLEFLGQGPHRLDAPSGKDEIVTVPRQFARKIGADAAGSAGYEGKGAGVVRHESGSELIRPDAAKGIPAMSVRFNIHIEHLAMPLTELLARAGASPTNTAAMAASFVLVRRPHLQENEHGQFRG
jgi:hypothetical protein